MSFAYVLALDIAGNPFEWITAEEAVTLYARRKVAWELGETERVFRGGRNRHGVQSRIEIRPIVAVAGRVHRSEVTSIACALPERGNAMLFRRDRYTCAYCAQVFSGAELTRDHIVPKSRGGPNTWMNCVSACRACNQAKGSLPVERFRPLVYLPYVPSHAEHFILAGRNILADQHEYLAARLPKHSRLLS